MLDYMTLIAASPDEEQLKGKPTLTLLDTISKEEQLQDKPTLLVVEEETNRNCNIHLD